MSFVRHLTTAALAGALALAGLQAAQAQTAAPAAAAAKAQPEQFFPLQSYRVGPYAAGGTGFFGGFT
ncbi:hypothetical protein ACP3WZ_26855, partial [Salmonella enterica]|uniref:hypothetical protein n=1 Tax=Salmonella enterica TaxID=28901 RepID=UPI003CEB7F25